MGYKVERKIVSRKAVGGPADGETVEVYEETKRVTWPVQMRSGGFTYADYRLEGQRLVFKGMAEEGLP